MAGPFVQIAFEADSFLQNMLPADPADLTHQIVEVDGFDAQGEFATGDPAQVEQIVDQFGFQLDVATDHRHVGLEYRGEVGIRFQGGGGHEHRSERGAKLMAEDRQETILGAARRLRHFLGFLKRGFGLLALRDVDDHAGETDGFALFIPLDFASRRHPAHGVVGHQQPVIDLIFLVGMHEACHDLLLHPGTVLGMNRLCVQFNGTPRRIALRDGKHPRKVDVPDHLVLLDIPCPGADLRGDQRRLKPRARIAQRLLSFLARGDVLHHAQHPADLPRFGLDDTPLGGHPALLPTRMIDPVFDIVIGLRLDRQMKRLAGPLGVFLGQQGAHFGARGRREDGDAKDGGGTFRKRHQIGGGVPEPITEIGGRERQAKAFGGSLFLGVKACVVHGNGRLRRDPVHHFLGLLTENTRLRMPEEQAAKNLARARDHRDCKITAHGRLAFFHSLPDFPSPVAWIFKKIMDAHHRFPFESDFKKRRVMRHAKLPERLLGRARKNIKHVRLSLVVCHMIEKCAKRRPAYLASGIGDRLYHFAQVELRRQSAADPVENLQCALLLRDGLKIDQLPRCLLDHDKDAVHLPGFRPDGSQ